MEIKALEAHLLFRRIKLTETEMLYQAPKSRAARLFGWVKHAIIPRRAHPVADIRELSSYLRADIGAADQDYPFHHP
ncbi:hypothetical protein VW23_026015 [Devosia insulae DS-56]|uniref:Uncharacterized protein n=2 Tax=Devosia insulae TaxID=408174 RepID=A0A1E5XLL2_9HYPH|nr:hypothetical protein VW23_026015 [Devosia insulae DS-56]